MEVTPKYGRGWGQEKYCRDRENRSGLGYFSYTSQILFFAYVSVSWVFLSLAPEWVIRQNLFGCGWVQNGTLYHTGGPPMCYVLCWFLGMCTDQ